MKKRFKDFNNFPLEVQKELTDPFQVQFLKFTSPRTKHLKKHFYSEEY